MSLISVRRSYGKFIDLKHYLWVSTDWFQGVG